MNLPCGEGCVGFDLAGEGQLRLLEPVGAVFMGFILLQKMKPRNHTKVTLFNRRYTSWRLCENPATRWCLASYGGCQGAL